VSAFIAFLSSSLWAVGIVAGLILAIAAWFYWGWFRPRIEALAAALVSCSGALATHDGDWPATRERVSAAAGAHPAAADAWRETSARTVSIPRGDRVQLATIGVPRDVWSGKLLLSRSMNVALAEAVPNLLVGIGLLFTFFFLTVALMHATDALFATRGENQNILEATRGLLSAAGAKFLTSLAGLLASIVWSIGMRRQFASLNRASEQLLDRLGTVIPSNGGELLVSAQLDTALELENSTDEQVALTNELLEEAREQTGTFKRFETDLAVSLAGAITQAFSPQMEAMTNRLIDAIDGLSGKLGSMNQDALEKMTRDFAAQLKQGTESEMAQLRQTLTDLATNLSSAGETLGNGTADAADKLSVAGSHLLERVGAVSEALSDGAQNLEQAARTVTGSISELESTIGNASELGKRGADFVTEALGKADGVFNRLEGVSERLVGAIDGIDRVSGRLADVVDSVDELATEQRVVVSNVREAVPETLQAFRQTRDSLAMASAALGRTVASITEGVGEYSKSIAELHGKMDEHLAKAVGRLDKAVGSLHDLLEELIDELQSRETRV
jgi:methyl-accepting chemotaxis protein